MTFTEEELRQGAGGVPTHPFHDLPPFFPMRMLDLSTEIVMENGAQREMPRYKCHKEVHALKIRHLVVRPDGGAEMTPDDDGYGSVILDAAFVKKHDPKPGGYYVVYADGYKSWSPGGAFESGYTRI